MVGRDHEQARLLAALERASGGRASGLMILGDAGIGKTALLRWARRAAVERGFVTLETVGVEGDVPAPYAGLQELLACVPTAIDSIDDSGLLSAVLDGTVAKRAARVAAAFLDLVTRVAERTPVLVPVDDANWIDGPTATAVGTLARRAEIDRVAVIVSSRAPIAWWAATGHGVLELAGLDEGASLALLRTIADVEEQRARDRWRATGGNPLALIELGPSWSSSDTSRARIPERLERAIDHRLDTADDAVAAALLVVALDPSGDASRAEAAAPDGSLDRAVAGRLLDRDGGAVRFSHPLVRARVVARAGADATRAAHAALAFAAAAAGDVEVALWHRAEAAPGPTSSSRRSCSTSVRRAAVAERRASGCSPRSVRRRSARTGTRRGGGSRMPSTPPGTSVTTSPSSSSTKRYAAFRMPHGCVASRRWRTARR